MVLMRICPWCRCTERWQHPCRCLPERSKAVIGRQIPGLDHVLAIHAYTDVVRRFVLAAKNGGRRDLLRHLGAQLADVLVSPGAAIPGDWLNRRPTVVWVPASRSRRRRRGFDQSRILARTVGHTLDLPIQPILVRSDDGSQEGRSRSDRLQGPTLRCRVGQAPTDVLIVDDVITTGASLATASHALRQAGTAIVIGVAVASVNEHRSKAGPAYGTRPKVRV